MTDELEEACAMLVECIDLRKKWLFQVGVPGRREISTLQCTGKCSVALWFCTDVFKDEWERASLVHFPHSPILAGALWK